MTVVLPSAITLVELKTKQNLGLYTDGEFYGQNAIISIDISRPHFFKLGPSEASSRNEIELGCGRHPGGYAAKGGIQSSGSLISSASVCALP